VSDAGAFTQPAATAAGRDAQGAELHARLTQLADSARTSLSATLCIIDWQTGNAAGEVRSTANASASDAAARTALRALDAHAAAQASAFAGTVADDGVGEIILARDDLAAISSAAALTGERAEICAASFADGGCTVRAALIVPAGRRESEIKASLQILGRAALAAVSASGAESSRAFWRNRATDALARLAEVGSAASAAERARIEADGVIKTLARAGSRDCFALLGAAIAGACGCDGWIVAAVRDGQLAIAAGSPGIATPSNLASAGAIAESFRSGRAIECDPAGGPARSFAEDRVFRRPWIAIPFDRGAIALASRRAIAAEARAKAEAIAAGIGPLVRAWTAEDDLARHRALVQRLALRMFRAIDEERARIARDLHDDQAQLLAAAQIALEGGRDEARAIFGRLEEELRSRTRELRPATLGRATLLDAIAGEFKRLKAAGIAARLVRRAGANKISRPVQELCYQVAREAFSNVIRHSSASAVDVAIERRAGSVRLSISDNGRGMARAAAGGMGLKGLAERLELMGGRLGVESNPRGTALTAEIPEPE